MNRITGAARINIMQNTVVEMAAMQDNEINGKEMKKVKGNKEEIGSKNLFRL